MQKCWEALNCTTKDTCPTYPDHGLKCWEVTGTLCRGEKQGSYEDKRAVCATDCAFYKKFILNK